MADKKKKKKKENSGERLGGEREQKDRDNYMNRVLIFFGFFANLRPLLSTVALLAEGILSFPCPAIRYNPNSPTSTRSKTKD